MSFLDQLSEKEREKLNYVKDFIEEERLRMRIIDEDLKTSGKLELSCYVVGEFKNLVYRQLIYTQYGYGAWIGLKGDVLDGLVDYINRVKSFREQ